MNHWDSKMVIQQRESVSFEDWNWNWLKILNIIFGFARQLKYEW